MINSIKNNTISEALAKQKLDALNKIKNPEIKNKRLINGQKILLSLFDDLVEATSSNNNNDNNSNNNNRIANNNNRSKNKNESINDNDVNDDNDYYMIKQLNNYFKTIDKTKSLKEQIEKNRRFSREYWHFGYHHGHKELNFKIFRKKLHTF